MTLLGVNLRVNGYSSQGGRKYMEDALVIAAQETEDGKNLEYAFFAVYDGHGGKEAALFAKEHLMGNITALRHFWSDDDNMILKAIRDGFLITHLAMWKEVDSWPKTSGGLPSTAGTTASVAFVRKGKLYIGHVGDSRIVLGETTEGFKSWQARSLTVDHKPNSPAEKERIYECGGLVMKKSGIDRVVWKRPKVGHQGPVRRSTDFDKIPFLAIARSLGDLWSFDYLHEEFVVSPEPDVSVLTLDPNKNHCLILASDGLWNVLTPSDAVHSVQDSERENDNLVIKLGISDPKDTLLNNPSKVLVNRAIRLCSMLEMRCDNTSVITVLIDHLGFKKSPLHVEQDFVKSIMRGKAYERRSNHSKSKDSCEIGHFTSQKMCTYLVESELQSETEHCRQIRSELGAYSSENCAVSTLDVTSQRSSSSSPLQSLNITNHLSGPSSRHVVQKSSSDDMENSPFPIPRWSKSASGQTSLLKLASWSKLVSWRHLSYPASYKTFCIHPSAADRGEFPIIPHLKTKQKVSIVSGSHKMPDGTTSSLSFFMASCREQSCTCSPCPHKKLAAETTKHMSALRHTIKRKYPGSELSYCHSYNCSEHFKCECSMPWKRKPIANRMGITEFKAINEFRMSQHHRLKF